MLVLGRQIDRREGPPSCISGRGGAVALDFIGAETGPANAAGIQAILKAQTQRREHQIARGHRRCPDFCALVAR